LNFELSFGQKHLCEVSLRGERIRGRGENSKKRLGTNKKTKRGLKAWIPAGVYPREDGDGNDREERIQGRRETSGTGREFMGKKTSDKYIL